MFMSSVPWTLFYKSSSGTLAVNIGAPSEAPLSAKYYDMKHCIWADTYNSDCVVVIGAIRGHHAVTAHIPEGNDYHEVDLS